MDSWNLVAADGGMGELAAAGSGPVRINEFEAQVRGRALEVCRKLIESYDHAA